MSKVLVSTGALIGRPNGRDYRLLEEFVPKLGAEGYEFMMYSDWYDRIDTIVEFINSHGIKTPVYHCQKSIGESISKGGAENFEDAFKRFEINVKMAARIGAGKIVVHLWDGVTSDINIENNLNAYKDLRAMADDANVDLLVENVVCNQKDPFTHWMELLDRYPDAHFIFDTKMAAFHNQLELLYKPENEYLWANKHIRHYHVNDYAGGYMDWANLKTLPIGKGNVDFVRFFEFIKNIGYDDTFTLESTAFSSDGTVDFAMLKDEISYIRNALF